MGLAARPLSLLPGPPFTVVLSRAESRDESAPGPTPPAPLLVTFTFLPQVFMQSISAKLAVWITVCLKVKPFNQMVGSRFGPRWGQKLAPVVQQVVQHWMIIKSDMSVVFCCDAGK